METNASFFQPQSPFNNQNYNLQRIQNDNDNQINTISILVNSEEFEDQDDEQKNDWLNDLCTYFPIVSEKLSQLTVWQRKNFINDLLAIYVKLLPCNTIPSRKYTNKLDLQQILLNAFSEFKTHHAIMSYNFTDENFGQVIQKNNQYQSTQKQLISFFLSSIQQQLLQLINFHKNRVEPEVVLKIGSRISSVKRSFQEMKATNSKKIIPGQELKQIKHKKKITKIKLGENGEIFFKQVEAKRSKQ